MDWVSISILLRPHLLFQYYLLAAARRHIMIEHPFYSYGNTEVPTPNDGALFHYTKFQGFLDIIKTMTLRSSPLCKMNDLNEANIDSLDWMALDFMLMASAQKYVKEQCSVISFTKNYMTGHVCQEGTNHPALWAHYAADSSGVCIVLDRNLLIANNKDLLEKQFYRMEPVEYGPHCAPDDKIVEGKYADVSDFVQRNYRELFFKKHSDWAYEDEDRFFIESPQEYLNIRGAIKYIALGGRLGGCKENLRQIIERMINPDTMSYHYFCIHSFVEMLPTVDGYMAFDASSNMLMQIQELARTESLAKDYIEWEKESFALSI